MKSYDFFIAYASPDRRDAEALLWALEEEHCTAFLDTQLPLGMPWPQGLLAALEGCHVLVVLVSAHTATAWYIQDEMVRYIHNARQEPGRFTVIPVLLDGYQAGMADMPYGTAILQAIDATRPGHLKRVARKLAKWLATQGRDINPETPLSDANYQALGAALRLDRYPHWSGVLDACGRPGHWVFLLHGARQQNVGLFVARIQHYLSTETRDRHVVYPVRFSWDGVTPHTGADWLRHVRWTLTTAMNPHGSLARAAQHHPLFLILGLRPLDRLDRAQQQGLQAFLETALPTLLLQERPPHGVRILLALDYAASSVPAIVQQADSWCRTAQASRQLQYLRLPPVTLPTWQDVEHYVETLPMPPSRETLEALHEEYQSLTSGRTGTYQELADLIDRFLQDA